MTPRVDVVLGDLWQQLLQRDRRALALIGHCNSLERRLARDEFVPWPELETVDRMALIRAMRLIGELAHDCAITLDRARVSLEDHALTARAELQGKIDEVAFAPPPELGLSGENAAEHAREMAQAVRQQRAEILRALKR